jgi:hypothetical protein
MWAREVLSSETQLRIRIARLRPVGDLDAELGGLELDLAHELRVHRRAGVLGQKGGDLLIQDLSSKVVLGGLLELQQEGALRFINTGDLLNL